MYHFNFSTYLDSLIFLKDLRVKIVVPKTTLRNNKPKIPLDLTHCCVRENPLFFVDLF